MKIMNSLFQTTATTAHFLSNCALVRCGKAAAMERVEGQVNDGDTILVDHSDGRTFFVDVDAGK